MKNIFFQTSYDADDQGLFGMYGGRYVPETLIPELERVEKVYLQIKEDPRFLEDLQDLYTRYAGRPTPLYYAENLTKLLGGGKIFLKNEGLLHTGAHKMNHCLGHALVAKKMGKKRIIAETGAGQHGLATATMAAKMGFDCTIYMGEIDYERQRPNVFWMEALGATVKKITYGSKTLKDAITGALQDWTSSFDDSYYVMGTAAGPHPFPSMVRDFQSIIGLEVKEQLISDYAINKPNVCIASVGGGCNALGLFNAFLDDHDIQLIGVEAGGKRIKHKHAIRFQGDASIGVSEGYKSYFIQDNNGQMQSTHSISAGLDYVGVGPQHAYLHDKGRVEYVDASDTEVIEAFSVLAKNEGIIAALESLHAVAHAIKIAPKYPTDTCIVVNLSGRGDKDLFIHGKRDDMFKDFLKNYVENYSQ